MLTIIFTDSEGS